MSYTWTNGQIITAEKLNSNNSKQVIIEIVEYDPYSFNFGIGNYSILSELIEQGKYQNIILKNQGYIYTLSKFNVLDSKILLNFFNINGDIESSTGLLISVANCEVFSDNTITGDIKEGQL